MNIVCLIKRVPDTASQIKVAGDGRTIDTGGVQFVLNPYDEYAVEAALQLKEKASGGTVTVLSVGPKEAQQTIRTALAMGADAGVHVLDTEQLRDPASVARTIADAISALEAKPDLILAGRQSVDGQSQAVGPMVATYLGLPCVTDIVELALDGQTAKVARESEGAREVLEVTLPCLLTANKGLNDPRYASLRGIMKAKRKKIAQNGTAVSAARATLQTMVKPPERTGGKIVGEGVDAVPELVRLLREEAKAL